MKFTNLILFVGLLFLGGTFLSSCGATDAKTKATDSVNAAAKTMKDGKCGDGKCGDGKCGDSKASTDATADGTTAPKCGEEGHKCTDACKADGKKCCDGEKECTAECKAKHKADGAKKEMKCGEGKCGGK